MIIICIISNTLLIFISIWYKRKKFTEQLNPRSTIFLIPNSINKAKCFEQHLLILNKLVHKHVKSMINITNIDVHEQISIKKFYLHTDMTLLNKNSIIFSSPSDGT